MVVSFVGMGDLHDRRFSNMEIYDRFDVTSSSGKEEQPATGSEEVDQAHAKLLAHLEKSLPIAFR